MELMYWWISVLLAATVIIGWIALGMIHKKRPSNKNQTKLPLANSWRLTKLPEYQRLVRRQQWIARGLICLMIASLLSSILLAGRPARMSVEEPEMKNRDIILCLDVSNSMDEIDGELTKLYAEMIQSFEGERIGMVVFNALPMTIFPLTNDYKFAKSQLEQVSKIFTHDAGPTDKETNDYYYDILMNTSTSGDSSLIGDGVAGCVNRFDQLGEKRSRSVILATDNYVGYNPIVTLPEAAAVAKDKNIRIYGIGPEASLMSNQTEARSIEEEYKQSMLVTGGDYYKMNDTNTIGKIIQQVTTQEATRLKGSPQIVYTDQPQIFIYVITALLAVVYTISWRIRS